MIARWTPGLARRLATGLNAALVAVCVVVMTGLVVDMADRHPVRWDLSADGTATLRPQTHAVLDRLEAHPDRPTVLLTAFSAQKRNEEAGLRDRLVRDLLQDMAETSNRVEVRFVDLDRDRRAAERLGVDRYGTLVVETLGDRVDVTDRHLFGRAGSGDGESLAFHGEAVIVGAIAQILDEGTGVVYVLQGHGERRSYDRGLGDLRQLGEILRQQGLTVRGLDLLRDAMGRAPAVPTDAAAVLVIGPKAPLAPVEEEALRAYLAEGGSLGVFVDPGGVVPDTLAEIGVTVPSGTVFDVTSVYPFEDRPLLRYPMHPITEVLVEDDAATFVAHSAPVVLAPREGVRTSPLLLTSSRGWIERGAERPSAYTDGVDEVGPVTVAAALDVGRPHRLAGAQTARVVVVGDSDLLGDSLLAEGPGNATFVANVLRWLVHGDERMSRVGRPVRIRRLAMTSGQLALVRWIVLGILPVTTLAVGAAVWTVRRRR